MAQQTIAVTGPPRAGLSSRHRIDRPPRSDGSSALESYFASVIESRLPFESWVAALSWVLLFFANHSIARLTRAANDSQRALGVEDWSAVRRGLEPKYVAVQIAYAGIVFVLALLMGGPAYVFFAGGFIVATICSLALNVQGLMSARALADRGATKGSLTFSTASALRHMAQRAGGAALGSFLLGLAVGHLALLGGAFYLAAAAAGFVRKAKKVAAG